MKIELENMYLVPAISFLQDISLKAADSRARSKFVKLLSNSLKELQESERDLISEYSELDAEGQPLSDDGGKTFRIKAGVDPVEYSEQHSILMGEVAEITGGTYTNHINKMKDVLENYEGELAGETAEVYDRLLDALENAEDLKGGE